MIIDAKEAILEKEEFLDHGLPPKTLRFRALLILPLSVVVGIIAYVMMMALLITGLPIPASVCGIILFWSVLIDALAVLFLVISFLPAKPAVDYLIDDRGLAISEQPTGIFQGVKFRLRPKSRPAKYYRWEDILGLSPTADPSISNLLYREPGTPAGDGTPKARPIFGTQKTATGSALADRIAFHLDARKSAIAAC